MSHVNLPDPIEYFGGSDDRPLLEHCPAIDEGRRISRYKNENLGGVAEADRLNGKIAQDISRNMVDEDQKECDPAKKIKSQVASCGRFDKDVRFFRRRQFLSG